MKRRLKTNGFIVFFTVLLVAIFPRLFLRSKSVTYFDGVLEILGIALILLGQLFRASARGYKSENSQNGHALVQGGPYALVRNPMYLGILMIGTGIVCVLFKWWVSVIFLFIFILRYLLLVFKEEKKLIKAFPEVYQAYCKKVPRLLPKLNILLDIEVSQCLPLKLRWIKKEIGPIIAVLLIALSIEAWQGIKSQGLKGYFKEAVPLGITIILFFVLTIYLIRKTNYSVKDVSEKSKNNLQ